ncbi:Putative nuclease [Frankliniella fusca]|uniref:Nuclease n=1 Tax=Frankliniella fusca TaxID=407009 RepID=A0AAE1L9S9_9NEOP|nr:Putative nuclease [Frankliniella fusca]
MERNFRRCRIPGVLGFVDGTLIPIKQPVEREELLVCRKGFHALNAQIICDTENHILNVLSRFNGSANDSYIWSNSSVRTELENIWANGERCWLLGDSGYPLEPWLHVPYAQNDAGPNKEIYNEFHRRARSVVERTIGLLKGRFRCLLRHRVLHYEPLKASRVINACCVLHNICTRANLELDEDQHKGEEGERQARGVPDLQGEVRRRNPLRQEAEQVRNGVALRLRR